MIVPTVEEKIDMCLKHLNYLQDFKNEKLVCLEIRNHIAWYLKGVPHANEVKNKIYQCKKIHDIILILESYKEEIQNERN